MCAKMANPVPNIETSTLPADRVWTLPPLILHPFADASGPGKLVESSRASLMLDGLLPAEHTQEELSRRVLEGRYYEIRMLYYVGKDVSRWIDQCADFAARDPVLRSCGLRRQSLAALLVEAPPQHVQDKLKQWGVVDYRAIFTRALGLNAVFSQVPERDALNENFLRHYYRFADHFFACTQSLTPFTAASPANFHFELYASGEYSKMLEREWEEDNIR